MKKLAAVVVAIILLLSFSVSVMAKGFDLDAAIADFKEDAFNTASLKVGGTDKPQAYIWAENGGRCYTSDNSVVTVAADGTVTAVGKGTAYVAIVAPTGMYQVYRYDVTAKPKPVSSKPANSKPVQSPSDETVGATEEDNTVSDDSSSLAPEADDTTTIGAISSETSSSEENERGEEIKNKSQAIMDFSFGMFWVLIIIFSVIFLSVIIFFVGAIVRSVRRPRAPKVPPKQTDHTPICPDCNCVQPAGAEECSICGRKLK